MYQLIFIPEDDLAEEVILAEFDTSFAAEAARDALVDAANDKGWVGYNGYAIIAHDELTIQSRFKPNEFSPDLIKTYEDGWEL